MCPWGNNLTWGPLTLAREVARSKSDTSTLWNSCLLMQKMCQVEPRAHAPCLPQICHWPNKMLSGVYTDCPYVLCMAGKCWWAFIERFWCDITSAFEAWCMLMSCFRKKKKRGHICLGKKEKKKWEKRMLLEIENRIWKLVGILN